MVQQVRERWGSPAGLPTAHGPRLSAAIETILQALGPSAPKWLAHELLQQGTVAAATTRYNCNWKSKLSEEPTS